MAAADFATGPQDASSTGSEAESAAPGRGGGPQTAAGRDQSRRNAMKDGLAAEVIFPEDLQAVIDQHIQLFTWHFRPISTFERLLVKRMGIAQGKLDLCEKLLLIDQERRRDRAATCWDRDREEEVDALAGKLGRVPSRVARGLERTKHGVVWLLAQWAALAACLRKKGDWDRTSAGWRWTCSASVPSSATAARPAPRRWGRPALEALVERRGPDSRLCTRRGSWRTPRTSGWRSWGSAARTTRRRPACGNTRRRRISRVLLGPRRAEADAGPPPAAERFGPLQPQLRA